VVLGNFNYQVENGGLEQWIYNGYFHDDSEKLIEYLEIGGETDERCRTILDRVYKLDQYAQETDCDRYGSYSIPDDEDGENGFIGDMTNCDAFDTWYYERCGEDDWWEVVSGIIDKIAGRESAPVLAAYEYGVEPIMVRNVDLAVLLLGMHATGGDYIRDAQYNVKILTNKGDDFFVMMNAGMMNVTPAELVFRKDTQEYTMWMLPRKTPDVRAFVISVTDRDDERVTGNLFEVDLYTLQDYIREHGVFFTHLNAEMKDGSSRRFTLDEWDAVDPFDRSQLKSWAKHYDPADKSRLATHLSILRWVVERYRHPVATGEFLYQISKPYMAQAKNPQPDMIRVAPEAAKGILAQSTAEVFRLIPNGIEKLSPIDAIKITSYQEYCEFALRRCDWAGIEKWAQHTAAGILRQNGYSERNQFKTINPEL
jgi:hypothetical protein